MKKTKFDLLFENIMGSFSADNKLKSNFPNEEYIEEYEYKPGWKIVIAEITENDNNKVYEFLIGKTDTDGNVIDWPYFESSNEYVSPQEAKTWAEGQVEDFIEDEDDE